MDEVTLGVARTRNAKLNGETYDVVRERTASIVVGDKTLTASSVAVENGVAAGGAAEAAQFGMSRNAKLLGRMSTFLGELEVDRIFMGEAKAGNGNASASAVYGGKATAPLLGWQLPEAAVRATNRDLRFAGGFSADSHRIFYETPADAPISLKDVGHVLLSDRVVGATISNAGGIDARAAGVRLDVAGSGHIEVRAAGADIRAADTGHIRLAGGANQLTALRTGSIEAGSGDDRIVGSEVRHVRAGEGNNKLDLQAAGQVLTGMGNDSIVGVNVLHVDAGGGDNFLSLSNAGHIDTWSGNDTIVASKVGHIDAGDGTNRIVAATALDVFSGRGADEIAVTDVRDVDAGDGDNRVVVQDARNLRTGAGADRIVANDVRSVDAGGGDDEIDATDVGFVVGGAGNDRISLERATALYRRGDGSDTIRAGEGAQIAFWDVKAADVNVTRVTDAQGNVTALDVALKDGSGSVRVERGPNGAEDAVLRFADGATMGFVDALPKRGAANPASPFPDLLNAMDDAAVFAARSNAVRDRRALIEVDDARAAAVLGRAPTAEELRKRRGEVQVVTGTTYFAAGRIGVIAHEVVGYPASAAQGVPARPAPTQAVVDARPAQGLLMAQVAYGGAAATRFDLRAALARYESVSVEQRSATQIQAHAVSLKIELKIDIRIEITMTRRRTDEYYSAWGADYDGEVRAVRIGRFDGGPGQALILRGKNGWRDAIILVDDPKRLDARFLAQVLDHLISGRYKRRPATWA
jgi:hypothetical protein